MNNLFIYSAEVYLKSKTVTHMKSTLPKPFAFTKTVFFVILSFLFCTKSYAQPPANDNCSSATSLISDTSCNATAGTIINATKTVGMSCGPNTSPDVWYSFVAQTTKPKIVLSNIGNDLQAQIPNIKLMSGTCGSLTTITCAAANFIATSGLTIGTTYLIRISSSLTGPVSTGNYNFNICIQDPLPPPPNSIDYSKGYINVTSGTVGGTINQGDILEIRATLVVSSSAITNVSYYDTLKKGAGFIFKDSIATRTNEGKNFNTFTPFIVADDPGWLAQTALLDTSIQINIGTGATNATGGSITGTSTPNLFGFACIIMATYRVKVDTGLIGYGRKINYGGGAFRYKLGGINKTISFPNDSLIVLPNLSACSDAVSPANLIGTANSGTFGTATSSISSQNGAQPAINTTYNYETYTTGPNDYYYGVVNNTSANNSISQTVPKGPAGSAPRVFNVWDITGDHTGATNTAKGNKPCDQNQPISASNPCGYMLTINAAYRSDKVFEYTATGVCSETYYEVSAWFKNLCYRCGCDVNGVSSANAGYIPTAPGDSSGVRPNIAMQIDGIDYYTTGDILYQGLGGTQTGSDTLNNWVRRSFVFKTSALQTSFKVTFRNNAPGGGGNDWAIDDIGLRTCYPSMIYAPTNPIIYMGNSQVITDTVRSYFKSYTYYKWQRKPLAGAWADVVPASFGNATPVFINGQYEYTVSYTIPGTQTLAGNSGDLYRMIVASSALNLANGCNFVPSTSFTLLPTDAPCVLKDTNYAIAPQSGNINWNKLNWSLGHVPTCCESAFITYTGVNSVTDSITVDITNDICIINLNLVNNSTKPNQLFRTVLHPGFNMQMNGNVRMGAPATAATDSCIFIARGGGNITVNGNTVIGYPADNAYCILGSAPDIASNHNYVLKGDSLTFNTKSFTNDKFITVIMNPSVDTAYLVNNTAAAPYPNAVSFENLRIGNGAKATTVIAAGTNQNDFINDRGGALEVTTNAVLVLPANYTINAKGIYNSKVLLKPNSTLRIGGYSGGTAGSNFPANFTTYNADPSSLAEYYGGSSNLQTVYGMTYGKLELRNGSNALGSGRAQKNSISPVSSLTSINVNQQTDFTLGILGSSLQPVTSAGTFNLTAGSGLYCNANVVSGAGTFTMGNGSYLGMGHALGITSSGSAGNMQMAGRNFNTTGNYIYNGIVNQVSGNGLPSTINELTIDNPLTVTNSQNVLANGVALLKQGVFDIVTTKFTSNGINGILNSTGGKMKASQGIVEMMGTSGTAQNLSGNWFVNKNISTLINANTKGITVAAFPADTILISSALLYGSVSSSFTTTNDNLTLLSRDTSTARFGDITNNSINGKVTVERYVPILRKWRLLAMNTTTAQTAKQSWMEGSAPNANLKPGYGTIVTDTNAVWSANGFDSKSISGPSVKYYDYVTDKYFGIPNTQSYDLKTKSAYYNFVRGDRTCLPANAFTATAILRTTGFLKTGNIDFPVNAGKFEMIGNPYASAVDLRTLVKTNLTPYFYIWDTKLTGIYGLGAYQNLMFNGIDYIISPGGGSYGATGSVMNSVESGQGLFIKSSGGGGNLKFVEPAKLKGLNIFSRSAMAKDPGNNYTANTQESSYNLLSLVNGAATILVDGVMAVFDKNYNSEVDYEDAPKLVNTSENVSIKRAGAFLAIERRKTIIAADTIFLNLTGLRVSKYQWDLSMNNMDAPGRKAFLIDAYTKNTTPLDLQSENKIQFDVENINGSYAPDRFMIVFNQAVAPANKPFIFTGINAERNADKTATIKYYTNYEKILQDYVIEHSNDGTRFTAIASKIPTNNTGGSASYSHLDTDATTADNYYRIRSSNDTGNIVYSDVAKISALSMEPSISIYPNPAENKEVNIIFVKQPAGVYFITISSAEGKAINKSSISITEERISKKLTVNNAVIGNYIVTVSDASGKKIRTQAVLIK